MQIALAIRKFGILEQSSIHGVKIQGDTIQDEYEARSAHIKGVEQNGMFEAHYFEPSLLTALDKEIDEMIVEGSLSARLKLRQATELKGSRFLLMQDESNCLRRREGHLHWCIEL